MNAYSGEGISILPFAGNWRDRFLENASAANATPAILEVISSGSFFDVVGDEWALRHAVTGESVNPDHLVSDERIEMSDWELLDFAVQVVRESLEGTGERVTEWQTNPRIDPCIWFVQGERLAWVVVRAARYPSPDPDPPDYLDDFAEDMRQKDRPIGFFAPVVVANSSDSFDPINTEVTPLWRRDSLTVRYQGLVKVSE